MNTTRFLLAAGSALLLSSCVAPATKPPQVTFHSSNESLLEDAERILALPSEARQKELALLDEHGAGHDNKIKRAMIYALINSPSCAAPKTSSPAASSDQGHDSGCDKWDKERKALSKQLKDAMDENQRLAQKARDEGTRADSLQQKLDELKNIERSIGNREQGTRK